MSGRSLLPLIGLFTCGVAAVAWHSQGETVETRGVLGTADRRSAVADEPWNDVELAADVERSIHTASERDRAQRSAWVRTLSNEELESTLVAAPETLGSISLGLPHRGQLLNGVAVPESALWRVVEPEESFGTEETIVALADAIETVWRRFPETPSLAVGHISREGGGYLRPHRSHQSGRDADVGYYYSDGSEWYVAANESNLDRARTWELVKAFVNGGAVEFVFMDNGIQTLLREFAKAEGEDPVWLEEVVFGGTARRTHAIVRHEWGHRTHMHVRFRSPEATALGERAAPFFANGRYAGKARKKGPVHRAHRASKSKKPTRG